MHDTLILVATVIVQEMDNNGTGPINEIIITMEIENTISTIYLVFQIV